MDNTKRPAYPLSLGGTQAGLYDNHDYDPSLKTSGLTKLEYFAGLAMQGLLSSSGPESYVNPEGIARLAVECAKATLEELSKHQ